MISEENVTSIYQVHEIEYVSALEKLLVPIGTAESSRGGEPTV
jgi:hypothetical protein